MNLAAKTVVKKSGGIWDLIRRSTDRAFWVGITVDLVVFSLLARSKTDPLTAQFISFLAAAVVSFAVRAHSSSHASATRSGGVRRMLSGLWVALAVLFLRGGLMACLTRPLSLPYPVAFIITAPVSCLVYAAATVAFVFPPETGEARDERIWPTLCLSLIAYSVALRLLFLGLPEILHEEGYYWNYAQHLDLGYLDHPPLVGWVVWLFTMLLGDSEFALRLGAFLFWFVGAYYCHGLTQRIFDGNVARDALVLYGLLPYYFGVSFIVLPDSSLAACWAGSLYYIYRFVIDEKPAAALGVGFFIGAGLLSKYTIVLMAAAAVIFLLSDRRARRWLARPEVYVAVLLAALVFLPVIVWNIRNDWASFLFQGPRRVAGNFDFSLPELLGSLLVLLTPTGVMAILAIALNQKAFDSELLAVHGDGGQRRYRLLMLLAGFPFAVILFFSLFRQTKLIWTGPVWIALLPFMARLMSPLDGVRGHRLPVFGHRPWRVSLVVLALLYGALLHYMAIGLPGIPYPLNRVGLGWRELSAQIENLAGEIENQTGQRPLVVGMDKDQINSWLAFYRGRSNPHKDGRRSNSGAAETGGRHLFGGDSNMYQFWFPPAAQEGKSMILVGRKPGDLTGPHIDAKIQSGGEVHEITVQRDGRVIRRQFYRIVEGYHLGR
jgi:dolichol-phosphate mannosyltransferase